MKKKLTFLALIMMMIICLIGCSAKDETVGSAVEPATATTEETTAQTDDGEDIVVAGIVFQDDQFMNMLNQGYLDAAAEAGVTVLTDNTNNDQAKETELINTYLAQGVNGLVISPLNGDASTAALRSASEQGMMIALTNVDIADAEFIVSGYTSDDYTNCHLAGLEAAEVIKEKLNGEEVKIALVQFKSILPEQSTARVNGYLDGLKDGGVSYEVVADQDAWMQDTALETTSAILTANADVNVLITVNDGGTIGATMAVQNAGADVLVFGHDGDDQISSMVYDENSPLMAVVAQDPYSMGYNAMRDLINAVRGGDYSDTKGKCVYLPGIVLSCRDLTALNTWRVDNGYTELK